MAAAIAAFPTSGASAVYPLLRQGRTKAGCDSPSTPILDVDRDESIAAAWVDARSNAADPPRYACELFFGVS